MKGRHASGKGESQDNADRDSSREILRVKRLDSNNSEDNNGMAEIGAWGPQTIRSLAAVKAPADGGEGTGGQRGNAGKPLT